MAFLPLWVEDANPAQAEAVQRLVAISAPGDSDDTVDM